MAENGAKEDALSAFLAARAAPKLVVAAPWPPVRNGVADYAATLLTALDDRFDILLVVDDDAPAPNLDDRPWVRARRFAEAGGAPGARILYQLGNNIDCAFQLPLIDRFSGVTMVHDPNLNHVFRVWSARHGDWEACFVAPMTAAYGAAGWALARGVVDQALRSKALDDEASFLAWVARNSRGVATHSDGATRLVAGHLGPEAKAATIPHFARVPEDPDEIARNRAAARGRLGFGDETFVISLIGFLRPQKQVDRVLAALRGACAQRDDIVLLIVGEEHPALELDAKIARDDLGRRVRRIGYAPEDALDGYVDASDVIVNLRRPTHFETSGVVCRALGRGGVCVVPRAGWYDELPDDAVLKVSGGDDPADLEMTLLAAAAHPEIVARRRRAAAAYARDRLDLKRIGALYADILMATEPMGAAEKAPSPIGGAAVIRRDPSGRSALRRAPGAARRLEISGASSQVSAPEALERLLAALQVEEAAAGGFDLILADAPFDPDGPLADPILCAAATALRRDGLFECGWVGRGRAQRDLGALCARRGLLLLTDEAGPGAVPSQRFTARKVGDAALRW